ncbi:MAG: DMT family transporter [Akkermansiaceae bacterium]|nr:DMT family transporter [Akkermansiaceae bacterium]MDG2323667.1 DMT family transporter [Akkermansiaceae bacterium]
MSIGDACAMGSAGFWAVSVILMRVSGLQIPPLPLTFFKNCVALACLALLLLGLGEDWLLDIEVSDHLRLVVSAVLGISLADTMIAAALNRLGASLQALADCAYAPSIALVGLVMFGEVLGPWELIGGALVISGVFVGATMTNEIKVPRDLWTGVALAAGAHVIMAIGILMVRDVYREVSVVWVTGYRFLIASLVMMLWAALSRRQTMAHLFLGFRRRDTWKTMIPMAILGAFMATLFWVGGFKYLPAGRAAIFNQLSTVFIIVLAYIFLKEKFTMRKAIGTGLALLGSVLVAMHE